MAGLIAASRAPLIVEDLSTIEVVRPLLHERLASLMGAPLLIAGQVLGVIHVGTIRPYHFTPEDLHLLQVVADRAALALDHSRLSTADRQAHARAAVLQAAPGQQESLAAPSTVALEHAQLVAQLQRRAEELEAVLESMVNGVALHNAQGELVRQNRAARELEAATGVSLARLLVEDRPEVEVCALRGEPLPLSSVPPAGRWPGRPSRALRCG